MLFLSEDGVQKLLLQIQVSVPTPDFPFTEFPSTEVVNQSQIDFPAFQTRCFREKTTILRAKPSEMPDLALKSVQNCPSYEETHEEMREIGDPAVSSKHSQSTRDPTTISIPGNSNFRKSTPGTKTDNSTALPVETSVSFDTEAESRSIMPTDDQALMALQDLLSDDFQSKKSNSLQRKGEDKKDEAFQLIQKIHNQLQQVQCDLQKLHSLHKYEF